MFYLVDSYQPLFWTLNIIWTNQTLIIIEVPSTNRVLHKDEVIEYSIIAYFSFSHYTRLYTLSFIKKKSPLTQWFDDEFYLIKDIYSLNNELHIWTRMITINIGKFNLNFFGKNKKTVIITAWCLRWRIYTCLILLLLFQ